MCTGLVENWKQNWKQNWKLLESRAGESAGTTDLALHAGDAGRGGWHRGGRESIDRRTDIFAFGWRPWSTKLWRNSRRSATGTWLKSSWNWVKKDNAPGAPSRARGFRILATEDRSVDREHQVVVIDVVAGRARAGRAVVAEAGAHRLQVAVRQGVLRRAGTACRIDRRRSAFDRRLIQAERRYALGSFGGR